MERFTLMEFDPEDNPYSELCSDKNGEWVKYSEAIKIKKELQEAENKICDLLMQIEEWKDACLVESPKKAKKLIKMLKEKIREIKSLDCKYGMDGYLSD